MRLRSHKPAAVQLSDLPQDVVLKIAQTVTFKQRVHTLPLVCKAWAVFLAQPCSLWRTLKLKVDNSLLEEAALTGLLAWSRKRAPAITKLEVGAATWAYLHLPWEDFTLPLLRSLTENLRVLRLHCDAGLGQSGLLQLGRLPQLIHLRELTLAVVAELPVSEDESEDDYEGVAAIEPLAPQAFHFLGRLPHLQLLEIVLDAELWVEGFPSALLTLTRLRTLRLSGGELFEDEDLLGFGQWPSGAAAAWPRLQELKVVHGGCLVESVAPLSALQTLHLRTANIARLRSLPMSLQSLQIDNLVADDPDAEYLMELTFLTGLRSLTLLGCDTFNVRWDHRSLPTSGSLHELHLENLPSGELDLAPGVLAGLRTLVLDDCECNEVPPQLEGAPELRGLWMRLNGNLQLDEAGLQVLLSMPKLEEVDLAKSKSSYDGCTFAVTRFSGLSSWTEQSYQRFRSFPDEFVKRHLPLHAKPPKLKY